MFEEVIDRSILYPAGIVDCVTDRYKFDYLYCCFFRVHLRNLYESSILPSVPKERENQACTDAQRPNKILYIPAWLSRKTQKKPFEKIP